MKRTMLLSALMFALSTLAQTVPSEWKTGTIVAVKRHTFAEGASADRRQYEVSVKVDSVVYTGLYTAPADSSSVSYREGVSLPVLVGEHTLTVNDLLGRKTTLPILHREEVNDRNQLK